MRSAATTPAGWSGSPTASIAQASRASSVDEGFALRREVADEGGAAMQAANRGAATARGLDAAMSTVAQLMRERHRMAFLDVGGWDTHTNQGAAQGALADNLGNLGRALSSYAEQLGAAAWKDTLVVVISEFGRTVRENGNGGTDHGHGTAFWLLGGGVRGGRIAGEQADLDRASLFQDRDLPVLNDYRAVLGGVFRRVYGLSAEQVGQVFPGASAVDLGLI